MAVDDTVAVAQVGTAPSSQVLIKALRLVDSQGRTVEVQGVSLIDENGAVMQPLSEQTGRDILAALTSINNILSEYTGCGVRIEPGT